MARQSPGRNAEDPADKELGDLDILDDDVEEADDTEPDAATTDRDEATESFWAEVRVDPVEIALPTGSGFTLRAYRPVSALTPTDVQKVDDEDDLFDRTPVDEEEDFDFEDLVEEDESRRAADRSDDEADDEEADRADAADRSETDEDAEETDDEADSDEDEESAEADEEEVPVFLGHLGKLFLFRTPESLVEFVQSDAEHDLAQLDTWSEVVARIRPEDVEATEDDSYELDLVVDNLRAGRDAWDADLVISAGELARDLAYAYRMESIRVALSSGTPLDDLDEAMRGTVEGGLGSFFARRRLRKIGAQQATLGWRTIIGKISGVVVWRD